MIINNSSRTKFSLMFFSLRMAEAAAPCYSLRSSRAVLKTLEDYWDEDVSHGSDSEVGKEEFFVSDSVNIQQESDEKSTEEQYILWMRCKRTYANEMSKPPKAHVWRTLWWNMHALSVIILMIEVSNNFDL